jgi:hypothetical protein
MIPKLEGKFGGKLGCPFASCRAEVKQGPGESPFRSFNLSKKEEERPGYSRLMTRVSMKGEKYGK